MAITTYTGWINNGSPAFSAHPIQDIGDTAHRHGYNVGRTDVYGLGDQRHLLATPPEDHTPYSNTPWPIAQVYPYVTALDIMTPVPAGYPSLAQLGQFLFDAKQAGRGELAWLKYMNWTDAAGSCWHDSWKPQHARSRSNDRGHIHLSCRSDRVFFNGSHGWDFIAEAAGMAISDADFDALKWRVEALIVGRDDVFGGPNVGEDVFVTRQIKSIQTKLDALAAAVEELGQAEGGGATPEQVRDVVDEQLDQAFAGADPRGVDDDPPAGP